MRVLIHWGGQACIAILLKISADLYIPFSMSADNYITQPSLEDQSESSQSDDSAINRHFAREVLRKLYPAN